MIVTAILVVLLSFTHVSLCNNNFKARNVCNNDYSLCDPKGASTSDEPPISSALSPLFIDILNTVDNNKDTKRDVVRSTDRLKPRLLGGGLCCTDGTQCLLLQGLNFPFCYDNYTTNYYLPGGSYGQITVLPATFMVRLHRRRSQILRPLTFPRSTQPLVVSVPYQ
ncbi:hypothetical protein JMJ35_002930 [Cladonia borealis]|uniref:Hydrophobin n=1 Tax=Cladonia borealis TaxID=184061 RepID=A0AA39R6P0_9LECA|nr:hypothetical protein JMJ35_002930 [Cladonia borealis]